MTYQEWLYAKVFGLTENFSRNFELKDLVPKQIHDKIFVDITHMTEGNMKYQDEVEQWRSAKIKADEQFKAYKKTVEGMDGRARHFDEMATEVMDLFEKTFTDVTEEVMYDYGYDMAEPDDRNDRDELINVVRKKLYDGMKLFFEKEETKMVCDKDYDFMGLNCSITVDRVVHTYDGSPEYQFSGTTNDIDELTKRIKNQPKREIVKIIPNRIWQNDGLHTTVEWRDGTKTTVCCEDPEKYTEWGGFCACVVKKLYGSATKAEFELRTAKETTAWPAKKKQIEREKMKAMKQMAARHKKELREQKITAKMEEMRITNEAGHRLAKEYSEKETAVAAEEG